jgi:hypothetical protein
LKKKEDKKLVEMSFEYNITYCSMAAMPELELVRPGRLKNYFKPIKTGEDRPV